MGARIVVIGPDKPIYNEDRATEAITPGMVVDNTTADQVEANDVATDGNILLKVAVENDIFGKGIDDAYAINDVVISQILRSGCEFYALVPNGVLTGENVIVYGDPITGYAGGLVAKGTAANAFAVALEALDNTGGAGPARLRCRVI